MSEYTMVSDPLFVGLTRPNLIFGVSLKFAMLNMVASVIGFIQTNNFKIVLVAMVLHGIGYMLCLKEPRFLELYIMKFSKCNQCPNRTHYGANSYLV
jgi:type IV secretion system protein VirB3